MAVNLPALAVAIMAVGSVFGGFVSATAQTDMRALKKAVIQFENTIDQHFKASCQSVQLLSSQGTGPGADTFFRAVSLHETLSPDQCLAVHLAALAQIPPHRLDAIYAARYQKTAAACTQHRQLGSESECLDLGRRAARRDYVLEEMTSVTCVTAFKRRLSSMFNAKAGACLSLPIPPEQHPSWAILLTSLYSSPRRPENNARPCVSSIPDIFANSPTQDVVAKAVALLFRSDKTAASAATHLAKAGFQCTAPIPSESGRLTRCQRQFTLHAFYWDADPMNVRGFQSNQSPTFDIVASRDDTLKEVCMDWHAPHERSDKGAPGR